MGENLEIVISPDARPLRNEWLESIMREKKEDNQLKGPRMPRVPSTFREIAQNKDCYSPMVVSIGPYHNGKEERFKEMQGLKDTLAHHFIKDCSFTDSSEMYRKVEELASHAREWYVKDETTLRFNDEQFAQMMFLDGCFVLQFLYCLYHHPENLKMASHIVALVARDLFLLENQLPFEVLDALMNFRFKERERGEGMELFDAFFKHIRAVPPRRESCREKISNILRPARNKFLELLSSEDPGNREHLEQPSHLLELFHRMFVRSRGVPDAPAHERSWCRDVSRKTWSGRYYPAEELRNFGIQFRPSRTSLFTDVKYISTVLAGRLYIPPLSIDDSTKSLLLNLVAYEACQGTPSGWITSYVCFMDSLINQPEDVKELRSRGILLNKLESDHAVAALFNRLAKNLVPNPYAYNKARRDIEVHRHSIIKRWAAEWQQTYFRSPWAFIAFVAAALGLIFTGISSYKDLFPTNCN